MPIKGLLLLNLGSPDSPTPKDVKTYLRQFLMDKFVIDIPAVLRFLLVYGLITPRRSVQSAQAYQKIWSKQGSPLTHFTRTFAAEIKQNLAESYDVRWAMRYGNPSIEDVVRDWKVDELNVVPLYPQYAESSSRSAIDEALRVLRKFKVAARVRVLRDFFSEPEFIETQASAIARDIEIFKPDRLLLSFHGLPEHHMLKLHPQHCQFNATCCATVTEKNRFCYRAQALATARELGNRLPLEPEKVIVGFQSRLGRRPWIKPYTDILIDELAAAGVKRVLVSCPSFVADCLETLEEIEIRLREQFLSRGGEALQLVPALNADPRWVKNFSSMIQRVAFQEASL